MCLKNRNYLLIILVFSLSSLSLIMLFSTNTLAININVPYEWYRYQGASDSSTPRRNSDCGPACVAMTIQFVKNEFVKIKSIHDSIENKYHITINAPSPNGGTNLSHLIWYLSELKINNRLLAAKDVDGVKDAINNENHIVICGYQWMFLVKARTI